MNMFFYLKKLFKQKITLTVLLFLLFQNLHAEGIKVVELSDLHTFEVAPFSLLDLQFPKPVKEVVTSAGYEDNFGVEIVSNHVVVNFKAEPKGAITVIFQDGTSSVITFKEGKQELQKVRFTVPSEVFKSEIPVLAKPIKKKELNRMIRMIQAMYTGEIIPEFKVKEFKKMPEYPLPSELTPLLNAKVYRAYFYPGTFGYVIILEAKKDCSINEAQFYALGIRAISILEKNLKRGQRTYCFIVSERPIIQLTGG